MVRLLRLEQRVVEDLAHWYGPEGSKRHRAAQRALLAWLLRLRTELESGCMKDWEVCTPPQTGRETKPDGVEGCYRAYFSPWDKPEAGGVAIAAGGHDDRLIAEVVEHGNERGIRVLAIGPKYAGRGGGREVWVYREAGRRRRRAYQDPQAKSLPARN